MMSAKSHEKDARWFHRWSLSAESAITYASFNSHDVIAIGNKKMRRDIDDGLRPYAFQLLVASFGLVHAQGGPLFQEPEKVLSESRDLGDTRGHYSFSYETEGGILQKEVGSRKHPGTVNEAQLIQGSVQYNAPDGTPIAMSWTADEYGTQVAGTHLPTPPPIPPAIQRALEWIAKQPSTPEPIEKDNPTSNAVPRDNRQYKLNPNI